MNKQEWIELKMHQLEEIQKMDRIGGSLAFAEMAEVFYELFGEELLKEFYPQKEQ
jgi:truncated hemoglobin YjbI